MSIAYDAREQPPAAFVDVEIINPTDQTLVRMRAKLDTGASVTVIPEQVAQKLSLQKRGIVLAQDYDANKTWHPVYFITMRITDYLVPLVKVFSSQRDNVLLGRDILNSFIITLDGKAQTFEMKDP